MTGLKGCDSDCDSGFFHCHTVTKGQMLKQGVFNLESDIEKYLKDKVEQLGGLCWKFTSPGTAGVPDRIVLHDGKVYFVELKTERGRRSKVQKYIHKKMREQKIDVYMIWSKKDVDSFVERKMM